MTRGRKRQAWATMAKLVPSAVYAESENDDIQDVEIKKVCVFLSCSVLKVVSLSLNHLKCLMLTFLS